MTAGKGLTRMQVPVGFPLLEILLENRWIPSAHCRLNSYAISIPAGFAIEEIRERTNPPRAIKGEKLDLLFFQLPTREKFSLPIIDRGPESRRMTNRFGQRRTD